MVVETNFGNIRPIRIEEEMRASYLDYAMSVIVARALPSVQDGLKPVQRRILYAMEELGLRPGSQYKKSARIVGEVLGKFHPHGDDPVYEAMVRMAQTFSLRYPLVDGQGNFGSVDNDPPAAMRYTEARLAQIAAEILVDIDRNTVDFAPNFDDSLKEPLVLPARLPNLLVNGASGIAVGMATNIPPHNLTEICDAVALLIDNPDASADELTAIVQGPDFPTGGIVFRFQKERISAVNGEGPRFESVDTIRQAYADGRGRFTVRARARIEDMAKGGRQQIVVTELPYQVNKAALIEKIADLVKDKRIDGISDIRDESDRHGMRIVIEVGRTGQAAQVLNALYKHTAMQTTFAVNMLALVDGQPRTVRLKTALEHYINFRREVIRRRSQFDLEKAKDREHILQGLQKALQNLDEVIKTIRGAPSAEEAKGRLMRAPFRLSDRQAQAVLDMQLRRLARLERQKIEDELKEIIEQINYLEDLLANPRKIDFLIKEDVEELKKKYGDDRRTQIVDREAEEFSDEDLVPHQEVVIALTSRGYVKRMPLETYRLQRRGGRGITGVKTREDDAVRRLLVCDTHDSLLFFTDRGRVFQLRTFEVPDASRQARGLPLVNLIEMDPSELVTAVVAARQMDRDYLVLATRLGEVKKTRLKEFASVRRAGLIAMDLEPKDVLTVAKLVRDEDEVILVTSDARALRYRVSAVPARSRAAGGVRGVRLAKRAHLVSMEAVLPDHQLLTITTKGAGKRTLFDEYHPHGRGTAGQLTFRITSKTGPVAAARTVSDSQELMLISEEGVVIRTRVDSIAMQGRATQGVSVMALAPNDSVASVAVVEMGPSAGPVEANGADPKAGGRTKQTTAREPSKAPKGKAPREPKAAAKPKAKKPAASRGRVRAPSRDGRRPRRR